MKGIFISYRRQDSQSAAGRLADHLREHMPDVPIFRDVETIGAGIDYVEAIEKALQSCGLLLAVIGPTWANVTDEAGNRRLDDPADLVRLEIAKALARGDVLVIPILVDGAKMPTANQLPEELKRFATRNHIELTDKRWAFDVSNVISAVREALGCAPPPKRDPEPPLPSGNWKKWAWGIGAVVVLTAIFNAEENGGTIAPAVAPAPQYAAPQQQAVPLAVTGVWQDAEGGKYRIMQQGGQVVFQGTSIHGAVTGAGLVQGNQFSFSYTVNGAPYQAVLLLSPDGVYLRGQYRSPTTGENGLVALQRIQ